ncbi:O-antigen ligase family protein [Aestuariicella hydrocarbonica]|uniref:O-antigen ligase family protein n=1 Tax=Pseudomaricurvus hydrocarbonicus TaxID=1470433 RepID=A0A9E5JW44_9GAMM|nr:O-antigen ligase family protein [Aestuariicella hydrocarbonica]NHO66349.1 O-antigen ligase family protein [Aestuariicella hydrocarbonica]
MPHTRQAPDRFIFFSFLALLVWIPLPLGSNRPWAWHLMELISFGLVAWWVMSWSREKLVATPALQSSRSLLGCLSLFAAVIAIQLLPLPSAVVAMLRPLNPALEPGSWATVSIDPQITWIHLRTTLCFIALAFLTLVLVNSKERLKWLAITLLVVGVFQGLYGSLMTLSGAEYGFFIKKGGFHGVATGTFWNRNNYANYLTLCIAAGTGLLLSDLYQKSSQGWRERGRRMLTTLLGSKVRVRIGLAMMVVALVLTKSRMGNTAFFVSLLVTGFCWLWLTKRITRGSIILLVSLVLIDSLIVGAWFGIDKVAERLETTAFTKETRDEVNRDTWTMIKQQPLLGSGAGSYYTAFPQYRQQDIPIYYDHAHNDYFEFLAEHGVLGCLPLLTLIILTLMTAAQTMRQRKTLLFQAMAFAPMMAVIALLLHSTVDFNLQIPANAATFVVLISLAWVVRYMPSKRSREKAVARG